MTNPLLAIIRSSGGELGSSILTPQHAFSSIFIDNTLITISTFLRGNYFIHKE